MFFGYGADDTTAMYYLQQAVVSARRIKKLNPGTNMTIVTNPTFRPPEVDRVFDMVRLQAARLTPNFDSLPPDVVHIGRLRATLLTSSVKPWPPCEQLS